TDQISKVESPVTETYFRQNVRPKERGLLLLYALNPHLEMTDETEKGHIESLSQTMPIRAASNAIAVAFVFPRTSNSKSTYSYIVNGTV
ncbi:MAG TPA: hypothetical protein PLH57_05370, partial [Oligoflexia bacterium]|nr:hypothetical protein [Oligoflexia bacterium]